MLTSFDLYGREYDSMHMKALFKQMERECNLHLEIAHTREKVHASFYDYAIKATNISRAFCCH
jgi:hypothetical protein